MTLEREEDEINLIVRKISRKWEDQPCHHEESSGQPCNQEAPSFPTLSSRKIQLISVIMKDRCQSCKITKRKKASSEKFNQTLSSRRKMRRTLPLGNSQNKRVQSLPSGRTHRFWFWLKGITGRDLRLAQPYTGYWFWLKGIAGRDLRLAQPCKFWFWLKGITGRDLRLAQPHTGYWFWVKGIAGRDLRFAQPHTGY